MLGPLGSWRLGARVWSHGAAGLDPAETSVSSAAVSVGLGSQASTMVAGTRAQASGWRPFLFGQSACRRHTQLIPRSVTMASCRKGRRRFQRACIKYLMRSYVQYELRALNTAKTFLRRNHVSHWHPWLLASGVSVALRALHGTHPIPLLTPCCSLHPCFHSRAAPILSSHRIKPPPPATEAPIQYQTPRALNAIAMRKNAQVYVCLCCPTRPSPGISKLPCGPCREPCVSRPCGIHKRLWTPILFRLLPSPSVDAPSPFLRTFRGS